MRIVIVGLGAVGGAVAAHLVLAGHDVIGVARGAHGQAIREHGLRFDAPFESHVVELPVVASVSELDLMPGDVVMLAVKSQDTAPVLDQLRMVATQDTPIVCLQNGIDNERQALRRFARVYGACVLFPSDHIEPGCVRLYVGPEPGVVDLGRYPHGTDDLSDALAEVLRSARYGSISRPDVMAWKHRKLILNLGNAVEGLLGAFPAWPTGGELLERMHAEGEAVLTAAGLAAVSVEEDPARWGDSLQLFPVAGHARNGGSTLQSLQRGVPVETDYLNGEIVLLGRLHGVPTPVNALLQQLLADAAVAAAGGASVRLTEAEILDMLQRSGAAE